MAILSVILCLFFCIFMWAFLMQLVGVALGVLKYKNLWIYAFVGISIYVMLFCGQESKLWVFPKTLGLILDWGGSLFCLIAGIYLTWKAFTNWKFFLGLLGFSAIILLIGVMLD